ncbi:hypothetical protein CLV62_104123 [Dysgonomonas alginatilytica]|uniref:Uncharacterized protein n=1 Tax=Dysgonomonas alginatilytica TaxID=1605892 RepID=A0A2V3PYJ8_9BACT|nr:hypothetical protein CLV62_104123 [Dysgonomonas alginatilytica]
MDGNEIYTQTQTDNFINSYETTDGKRFECHCGVLLFKVVGNKLQFKCRYSKCKKIHEIDILELVHKIRSGEV